MKVNNTKKNVRKSFAQSCVDTFRTFVTYKSKSKVIEVDEWGTTQTNCITMERFPEKVELKDREVKLAEGLCIDRDR